MDMLMRSQDMRAALLRGARQWPLLALPLTVCAVGTLLISGTAPPLAPPTSALIATSTDAVQLARSESGHVTLLYTDPGRGQNRTLLLSPTSTPRHAATDNSAVDR